ncbi:Signal transduction histidine kinase [Tenacibaculum sp. MAR_2009_124]|uniref:hybrid sensor histidine kinase/response regulator transcription factor n=1 Tax=Tenacibaculum sp. MAR_2009_124 TaxID=1250059 RepID=UPI00089AE834|nr:response regulator [Tenacibaculum sp. MAR_2009_124]SEB35472.1 Signal transduction histidine kinase [Tenacibaculum sp. MAR_2009_124]
MTNYFLKVIVLLIIFASSSCGFRNSSKKQGAVIPYTKKEYDSLRTSMLNVNLKSNQISELVNKLLKESEEVTNLNELAKRQNLLVLYYLKVNDYKKADLLLDEIQNYYRENKKWKDYVALSKIRCISLRGRKRYAEMETILKEAIEISKKENVAPYDLLPIHELSVFYSYDVGKHREGIKYGSLFFEKLKDFNVTEENKKLYDSIKLHTVDVLNLTLGKSYVNINNLENAYKHLKSAEQKFLQDDDVKKIIRVYANFIEYYLKKGELGKVKDIKTKYLEYNSRLNNFLITSNKRIAEDNINLMKEEREGLVEKEENKRRMLIIGSLGTFLLLVIIFQRYFLRLKYEKERIHLALEKEQEFKKFRASLFINIAHEIRTPLSLILGYIDLSEDQSISESELERYLKEIKRKSNKIINNISDIISLLKEDKKEEEVVLEKVVIEPFLQQLFFSFESVAKIKRTELNYNVELPANYSLRTNLNKLESLISNLVSNAIKFSPKNSVVTFTAFLKNDIFHIHVKDEGSGISKKNQKYIFSKFYQEEKLGKSEGFGIGLAIVKDIVDKLQGSITVKSDEGRGAVFMVKFPVLHEEENQEKEIVTKKIKNEKDGVISLDNVFNKGSKLLIVEDNPYMVDYYDKILSKFFRCDFAFNGEKGLEKMTHKEYDLIISDVMMPQMNGIELRKSMKGLSINEKTPFIMVTALGYEDNKIEAFNIGIDDYIVKPFSKKELIARVNCLIENKQKREEWVQSSDEEEKEIETFEERNLRELQQLIQENIHREDFSVAELAEKINFSQRQLERITKKLTGLTPVKFVLEIRLQEAYKKIKNKEEADINNVRYSIGMKSASYFSVKFKERFGISPSELLKDG